MFLLPDESKQVARLFNFFLQGELLATECARKQIHIFSDKYSKRFLIRQARQELFHTKVFKAGIGILMPRGVGEPVGLTSMQSYRRLLEAALQRGDQAESLLGMQIILEGLADVALKKISMGFPTRGLNFRRVRKIITAQEDAHHLFGIRRLSQLIDQDENILPSLLIRAEDYIELTESLMASVAELFEYFDEEPAQYLQEFHQALPAWLMEKKT